MTNDDADSASETHAPDAATSDAGGERASEDTLALDAASDDRDAPLAAVVVKPRAEVATASLRAEGVYDDDRRVRPFDADTVALPVTAPPQDTAVRRVVRQPDPEYRSRDLADYLRERGWSDDEIAAAPASWAVVGSVVLVADGDYRDDADLGDALLELHGDADTVCVRRGVTGTHRTPDLQVIAGTGDTETVHVEHGTRYALDCATVMFSPGNQAERVHMGEVVDDGERVFDMFAGIGYFALPMARAGADVTAVELNPEAYRYLVENAKLNDVTGTLQAILGDCRDVETTADRVVMGYYGVSEADGSDRGEASETDDGGREQEAFDYLDAALSALEPGGVVHVHAAVHESDLPDGPADRVRDAAADHGRDATVDAVRRVKSHSEGVAHVVVDATVH
ncbi:class I SAM-dependent methyltransferase family protein [Halorubellus sp. JP-L1]|uniref:class I SAM-dependent methyltransferase n=1 Tax=Halorubellus sp. JP-L1 TaxID=2715753 RepID=UPI0014095F31|nr:class I SAM-dependent methyltransferase family protein [Halorubellus sp. JP-L1]NHN43373.1 class I SAM-dependent methyltransferase family protein [Halorubellus sp. JP-L1]